MSTFEGINDWDLQAIIRGWSRNNDHDEVLFNMNNIHTDMPSCYEVLGSLNFHHHHHDQYGNADHEHNFGASGELEEVSRQFPMQLLPTPPDSIPVSSLVPQEMKTAETRQEIVSEETMLVDQPRRRRNKHEIRVIHQESKDGILPVDEWNWRKYGQKPIKGSPYPRSYYRCSSLQGCIARKQVEQSITNPGIYIITHIAEHNHPHPTRRYSQAGRTINRFPSSNLLATKTFNSGTTAFNTTSTNHHPYYCCPNLVRTISAPEPMLRTIKGEVHSHELQLVGSSTAAGSSVSGGEGTVVGEIDGAPNSIWDANFFLEPQEYRYGNGMCMGKMDCGGAVW